MTAADFPIYIRRRQVVEIGEHLGYSPSKLVNDILPTLPKHYPPGRDAGNSRAFYRTTEVFRHLTPQAVNP